MRATLLYVLHLYSGACREWLSASIGNLNLPQFSTAILICQWKGFLVVAGGLSSVFVILENTSCEGNCVCKMDFSLLAGLL